MPEIVLASQSPRRRELLARIVPEFRVFPVDVDEASVREKDPARFAVEAAILKARTAGESFPDAVVIAADTVVALGREILGKPADRADARAMLRRLSGRRHRVITGVALFTKSAGKLLSGFELTHVTFRALGDDVIDAYLDRGEFADKAGAYAIQDVGDAFVRAVRGDYDNVVGFPVRKVRHLLALFTAPEPVVDIEDLDAGGGGTARDGRRRLAVAGGVPGDRVRVRVVKERPDGDRAEISGFERRSPRRADPACPHFGACGGCRFQHVGYDAQLEAKNRRVLADLAAGGIAADGLDVAPIRPSPSLYGYRNKMEFAFGEDGGRTVVGLRERDSEFGWAARRTIPLRACAIFGPLAEAVLPVVAEYAASRNLPAFDVVGGGGLLRHLVLRQAKRTGEWLAVLSTGLGEVPGLDELARALGERAPGFAGLVHVRSGRPTDVVTFDDSTLVSGRPDIEEIADGLRLRITASSFFQTNTEAAELLYRRLAVVAAAGPSTRVLGLYCGAGPIEIALARTAGAVRGVDSVAENIANAVENAGRNGAANCRFEAIPVERLSRPLPADRPDLLVLDPPRAGMSEKALRVAGSLGIPRVLYVSCNAASLARDATALGAYGYRLRRIEPFDFFPHTPHCEVLSVLEKEGGR